VTDPAKKPATYEDLFDLPEHLVAEILDGEPFVSPRPGPYETNVSLLLGTILVHEFGPESSGRDEWRIVLQPELHLGADTITPDLAGWRRERMPKLPSGPQFDLAPDWVCETTSAGTVRLDRMRKRPCYARHAIPWLWMLDAGERSLEAYELLDSHWMFVGIYADEEKVRTVPFDAVEIALRDLWS
jgi:Uma2 family endonuclease